MQSIDTKDKLLGKTAKEWVDLLTTQKAADAARSLNYFDGEQEDEIRKILNDANRGRKKWVTRGLTPRFRNITKMVVEKSGLLFKDSAPALEIFPVDATEPDAAQTEYLAEHLSKIEFGDFLATFDQITRLLKTSIALVQWDTAEGCLLLDVITRANGAVVINAQRKVTGFVWRTSDASYGVMTDDTISTITEASPGGNASFGAMVPNPFKMVTLAQGYDTASPRTGFWSEQDKSLVNMNEIYNLHLSDAEFSVLWMKMSTLYTNMRPEGGGGREDSLELISPTDKLGRGMSQLDKEIIGGPGQVVQLDTMGVENPFIEYKAPQIELQSINDVVNVWVQDSAADWSVRIRAAGEGTASSGFQLVVEEMANLDLRRQRQRMFEAFFKRFYRVLARVINVGTGMNTLDDEADCFAKFTLPKLPVDQGAQQKLWDDRIAAKLATPIDYFIEEKNMTEEEAWEKWKKNKEFFEAEMPEPIPTLDALGNPLPPDNEEDPQNVQKPDDDQAK